MSSIKANKILEKVVQYGDRLAGNSARQYAKDAESLKRFKNVGVHGVPESTINRANRLAAVASGRSKVTRIRTGLGVGATVTGGFLGIHKYHQHKDKKIMDRIESMYYNDAFPS